jgi:uncharacterized protein
MGYFDKSIFSFDSFRSLLTGLGIPGRDKVMSLSPSRDTLTYNMSELENLYRGNWLAKKIVDIPAFDCTRSWRSWDAEQDQVEKLEDAEREFGLQRKMLDAMIKSRLYGGAAMLMGIKGQKFNDELDLDKVGEGDLKFIHVVEKWMIQAGPRVRDITSPWFGEPSYYMRSNTPIIAAPGGVTPLEGSSLGYAPGDTIFIHPSRVVRLVGIEYPDVEHSPDAWGDSVLSSVYEAIRDAGLVTQSLANMIADGKVDVFKIPGLTSTLSTQAGTNNMISYLANANVAKSVVNALVIDKEIDWERIQTKFEGLPQVLQAYLMICSAGADIPSTRMLSREPSGQNATGESDTRNYYDRLSSEQAVILTPTLSRLDEVLIRHSLGDRPKEITYEWNPLWQMTDTEKADIALKKSQAYKIDVDTALIPAEALVIGRQNQLIEDGVYPGLKTAIDDLEKNWNEEAEFLPVQQMGQQSEMQEGQQSHEQGMQKEQLSSSERMAKQFGKPGDDDDEEEVDDDKKTNDMFRDAHNRLAFIRSKMYDEGGQSGLGFMVSGRKRSKLPFDVSDEFVEELHPREKGKFSSKGSGPDHSKVEEWTQKDLEEYRKGHAYLNRAAMENAGYDETRSLLNEHQVKSLTEMHGDLRSYYENNVVPKMEGSLPQIEISSRSKFLVGYHGTTKEVFLAAKREGLKPKGSKGSDEWARQHDIHSANIFTLGDRKMSVYLAAEPGMAAAFAKIASTVRSQTPTLLEIHIPSEFVKNAVPDASGPINHRGDPSFIRYKGTIKPEWIVRELPFDNYKNAVSMGMGGTGVSHDSDKPLVLYAIIFDALPMEIHDAGFEEEKHPRGQPTNKGQFGSGGGGSLKETSGNPTPTIFKGESYLHLLPPTARTKAGAENTFYNILEKDQPLFYHESPGDISSEVEKGGIKGGYGVFAAVGQDSDFVTSPVKTVISFKIPLSRIREVTPDMIYSEIFEGDVGNYGKEMESLTPYEQSLLAHPNRLKGLYVSTNFENIPRSWIKSIEVRRPDKEPEKIQSNSRVYLDPHFNQWRFEIRRNGQLSHSAGYHSKEEAIAELNKKDRWGSKDSDDDPNSELPRHGHENDPIEDDDEDLIEDAGWEEGKHPRGQPTNAGQFGSGGGSSKEDKIASREKQTDAVADIVDHLRAFNQVMKMPEGRQSKYGFILQHGTPYMANSKTYAGKRGEMKLCFMNASHDALDHKDRTYVEGFITVHGVPIEHAWTVDKTGQIYDTTIRPDVRIAGYYGVPFTRDYLMHAMGENGVYGLLGSASRKTIGPLLRGEAKNFKQQADPDKLTSDVIADRLSFADRVLSSIPVTENLHSPERMDLRTRIVDALYNKDIDKRTHNKEATIVLGLPGSGKSTLSIPLVKAGRLEIEGDNAKAMLPEFQGGVGAYAVHEESSSIMRRVLAKAIAAGDDIVWPRIDSQDKIVKDVKSLHDAGYKVNVKLADVPAPVAIHSAITRFIKMGRYVSPEMIVNYGNSPRESYDAAIKTGLLASYQRYKRGSEKGFVEVT